MNTFTNVQIIPEEKVVNDLKACLLLSGISHSSFSYSNWRDDLWLRTDPDSILIAQMMAGMGYIVEDTSINNVTDRIIVKYYKVIPYTKSPYIPLIGEFIKFKNQSFFSKLISLFK